MIEVTALTKSFGSIYALRGVSLSIPAGASICIVGPNGAGKSTFLRILSTLTTSTSGDVTIAGVDIRKSPEAIRERVGVIGHATFLYDELTASENLQFYARLYGLDSIPERIATLLEQVGLTARRDDRVRTFSRGMQQRLSIARALLHNPEILFLDEPFTGLDQHGAQLLSGWLDELRSQERTLVLVTHNLALGHQFADRLVMFRNGKIVLEQDKSAIPLPEFQQTYYRLVSKGGTA